MTPRPGWRGFGPLLLEREAALQRGQPSEVAQSCFVGSCAAWEWGAGGTPMLFVSAARRTRATVAWSP